MEKFKFIIIITILSLLSLNCKQKVTVKLADKQYENGDFLNAIDSYNYLIKLDSNNAELFYKKALIYNKLQKYDSTIINLKIAVLKKIDLRGDRLLITLGIAQAGLNQNDDALVSFQMAYSKDSLNYLNSYNLAITYLEKKEFSEALYFIKKSETLTNSKRLEVIYVKAEVLFYQMNYYECIETIKKCLLLNNKDPLSYSLQGKAYYALDKFDSALICHNYSISLNPEDQDFIYQRACTLLAMGDTKSALNDCNLIINKDSLFANAYYLKSVILFNYFNRDEGCNLYKKYIRMDSNYIKDKTFDNCFKN